MPNTITTDIITTANTTFTVMAAVITTNMFSVQGCRAGLGAKAGACWSRGFGGAGIRAGKKRTGSECMILKSN